MEVGYSKSCLFQNAGCWFVAVVKAVVVCRGENDKNTKIQEIKKFDLRGKIGYVGPCINAKLENVYGIWTGNTPSTSVMSTRVDQKTIN